MARRDLRALLEGYDGIGLRRTATRLVFADGNPKAVLFRAAGPEKAEVVGNVMGSRGSVVPFFLAQRAPFGFYGFEAMALILDAVAEVAASETRLSARRARRSSARLRRSLSGLQPRSLLAFSDRQSSDCSLREPARRRSLSVLSMVDF